MTLMPFHMHLSPKNSWPLATSSKEEGPRCLPKPLCAQKQICMLRQERDKHLEALIEGCVF